MNLFMERMGLLSTNYQGKKIYNGAGIFIILGYVLFWLILKLTENGKNQNLDRLLYLILLIGAVGLIDDLVGQKDYQGFKGHFGQLLQGKLTTGVFKAVISLLVVFLITYRAEITLSQILNIGLLLLWTNFFNLLDLRPGRALKFFIFCSLILLMVVPVYLIYLIPIYLILIFYFPLEMQGKYMLGDTGANVLGALTGYGFLKWEFTAGKTLLFLILISLTLLSERYSFSQFIRTNRFLNWLDQLGRLN